MSPPSVHTKIEFLFMAAHNNYEKLCRLIIYKHFFVALRYTTNPQQKRQKPLHIANQLNAH